MGKNRTCPRKFNLAGGRHTRKYKRRQVEKHEGKEELPIKSKTSIIRTSHQYSVEATSGFVHRFKKKEPALLDVTGNRIISVSALGEEITRLTFHAATCKLAIDLAANGKDPIKFLGVGKSAGLACYFHSRCNGCGKRFIFGSSKKIKTQKGADRFTINVRGVWGEMATGGGGAKLRELMGTLGIPSLAEGNFCTIEDDIRVWWEDILQKELMANAREEKRLAIEAGDFHQDVPAITVVTDGGWSKRSHKHSYNALGGVGVIFGARTGKLLHMGVRNKYCAKCSIYEGKGTVTPQHECFKNWTASSQSMESDIILEGFKECEAKFGMRYLRLVGDGDSSTYAKLINLGPHWCKDVQKIECANHSCKCLRGHLEKLVVDNPKYKGQHGLTKSKRGHIVSFVRSAIRQRSLLADTESSTKLLSKDITSSLWHVFGHHGYCLKGVCKANDQLEVGEKNQPKPLPIPNFIVQDVAKILDNMSKKSRALISNNTTNLCEGWMSLRAKFDGGKQINRCAKGSWHARCYGAALRSSFGPQWSPTVWNAATEETADPVFCKLYRHRFNLQQTTKISESKVEVKRRAIKRKYEKLHQSQSKQARLDYGKDCLQVSPDVDVETLEEECSVYYTCNVLKSDEILDTIEQNTRQQSMQGLWHAERAARLTSSNFFSIVKRKPQTSPVPLVKRLLYSTFKGNKYTEYGLIQEESTIDAYIEHQRKLGKTVDVDRSGLVVSRKHKFLACSPDGLVREANNPKPGLLEIKNLLMGKNICLKEACSSVKSFCLQENSNGSLTLKKSHQYYFQCQGQLAVCNLSWLDFVVRTTNPPELHVERIFGDEVLWSDVMLPRLASFFFEVYLPELSSPRSGKEPGIRNRQNGLNSKLYSESLMAATKPSVSSEAILPNPSTSSGLDKHREIELKDGHNFNKKRQIKVQPKKFVASKIHHKWILNEDTKEFKWYHGKIMRVLKGRDGVKNAVYEVMYFFEFIVCTDICTTAARNQGDSIMGLRHLFELNTQKK